MRLATLTKGAFKGIRVTGGSSGHNADWAFFVALSHEDVSGENDEAANSERGVDADQYPGVPSLEDLGGKKGKADQCCQRDKCSSTYAEGGVSLIQPARRPDQR